MFLSYQPTGPQSVDAQLGKSFFKKLKRMNPFSKKKKNRPPPEDPNVAARRQQLIDTIVSNTERTVDSIRQLGDQVRNNPDADTNDLDVILSDAEGKLEEVRASGDAGDQAGAQRASRAVGSLLSRARTAAQRAVRDAQRAAQQAAREAQMLQTPLAPDPASIYQPAAPAQQPIYQPPAPLQQLAPTYQQAPPQYQVQPQYQSYQMPAPPPTYYQPAYQPPPVNYAAQPAYQEQAPPEYGDQSPADYGDAAAPDVEDQGIEGVGKFRLRRRRKRRPPPPPPEDEEGMWGYLGVLADGARPARRRHTTPEWIRRIGRNIKRAARGAAENTASTAFGPPAGGDLPAEGGSGGPSVGVVAVGAAILTALGYALTRSRRSA